MKKIIFIVCIFFTSIIFGSTSEKKLRMLIQQQKELLKAQKNEKAKQAMLSQLLKWEVKGKVK